MLPYRIQTFKNQLAILLEINMTNKKNPISNTEHIQLTDRPAHGNRDIESNNPNSPSSAWNLLNMCHGVFENISACTNQYVTRDNAILLGTGLCVAGTIAGVITVIVLYAVPDCKKELTFEVRTNDEVKFDGKPPLYKYDYINFNAPATKEEQYDKKFTINPGSLWPNDCELHIKVNDLTKSCETYHQAFTCKWYLETTGSDDDTSSRKQDSFVESAANSFYSLFFNSDKTAQGEAVENLSNDQLVKEYNSSTFG